MKGVFDDYTPRRNSTVEFNCADADHATDWLDRLDGKLYTMLSFEDLSGWTLMVGGGPELFVVVKSNSQGYSWTRTNASAEHGAPIELCAGGQPAEFERRIVCPRDQAVDAIREFFRSPPELGGNWDLG